MKNEIVFIVGGGIAGLTAGIYLTRAGFSPVVFEKSIVGGLAALAGKIENFPGFPKGITGMELVGLIEEQYKNLGGKISNEEIAEITRTDNGYELVGNNRYFAKGFILSSGTLPKKLGVIGEDEFVGRGVSYCGVCDAPFYRDKIVAVVGGGNTAIYEAIHIAEFARKVYLVHRRTSFRAFDAVVEKAKKNPKIEFILNSVPREIIGHNKVEAISIEYLESGERVRLEVDGVFIFAGFEPNTKMLRFEVETDSEGYIITDKWGRSSAVGMFVAGDVRSSVLKQMITAAADGAIAAVGLSKFLKGEM